VEIEGSVMPVKFEQGVRFLVISLAMYIAMV